MNVLRCLGITVSVFGLSLASFAQTDATATLLNTGFAGGLYDYTITLHNTGTTSIETFWYSWVPGQDYMATPPSNFSEGSAWNAPTVTGAGNASDGYAIRWESSTGLAKGNNATFGFWSASTPAELSGNSKYFSHPPVGTAFVYSGIFPAGTSHEFVVQTVPTPPGLAALALGVLGLLIRRKSRRAE